ncbi:MAG: hypothetical protein LAT63_10545 [Marinobacter sp.]|nr:hypothetical protein [Marinobacter sp.]
MLSADHLLTGSNLSHDIEVPASLLGPVDTQERLVRLRPLSVQDLRLIGRAARENDDLTATLMVQRAMVEPVMTVQQVAQLPAGLMHYLLHQVNRISGIGVTEAELAEAMNDPLTQASFELARAFGWTPEQISELTVGQVMLHLQMLRQGKSGALDMVTQLGQPGTR